MIFFGGQASFPGLHNSGRPPPGWQDLYCFDPGDFFATSQSIIAFHGQFDRRMALHSGFFLFQHGRRQFASLPCAIIQPRYHTSRTCRLKTVRLAMLSGDLNLSQVYLYRSHRAKHQPARTLRGGNGNPAVSRPNRLAIEDRTASGL